MSGRRKCGRGEGLAEAGPSRRPPIIARYISNHVESVPLNAAKFGQQRHGHKATSDPAEMNSSTVLHSVTVCVVVHKYRGKKEVHRLFATALIPCTLYVYQPVKISWVNSEIPLSKHATTDLCFIMFMSITHKRKYWIVTNFVVSWMNPVTGGRQLTVDWNARCCRVS